MYTMDAHYFTQNEIAKPHIIMICFGSPIKNACITPVICSAIVDSTSLSWAASSIIKLSNGAAKFMQLFPEDDTFENTTLAHKKYLPNDLQHPSAPHFQFTNLRIWLQTSQHESVGDPSATPAAAEERDPFL